MKNQKGITLISVIIYVLVMIIVVALVANITRYFYHNVNTVTDGVEHLYAYTAFNAYFSEEINIYGNAVVNCNEDSIVFLHNNNQYKFENNAIYFNRVKICDNIKQCKFNYNSSTKIIKVTLNIDDKIFENSYTITSVKY